MQQSVRLEESNADEYGRAIHEECLRLTAQQKENRRRSDHGKGVVGLPRSGNNLSIRSRRP
jgi:hypothetical protein